MTSGELLLADLSFRLRNLTVLGWVDLALVTAVFFLVMLWIRRSRVAFLLRGALVLGILLLAVTYLLPLPTFDWLVRAVLLAILVATPIILQPELRRVLERVGRATGLTRAVRQQAVETTLPALFRAVEQLAAARTGALIVLEGNDVLTEALGTGVAVDSRITHELLQTIFFDKTPLHDGAVIVRGDRLLAAGCVLPLTNRRIASARRVGTRHRAALGLSEVSDALVIVVSEETGAISVAHGGRLVQQLEGPQLRQRVVEFYAAESAPPAALSLAGLRQRLQRRPGMAAMPGGRQVAGAGLLLVAAALLSLALWAFVLQQTNPIQLVDFESVPLRVVGPEPGLVLLQPAPAAVDVTVRATAETAANLQVDSLVAELSLAGLPAALHQLPIEVMTAAPRVQIVSVSPPVVDLELAAVISRTLPVAIELTNLQDLSTAYEITGQTAAPAEVVVSGPETRVAAVERVQAVLAVGSATASLSETRPLRALDASGAAVAGVSLDHSEAQVTVRVRRRQDARDVGVRAATSGQPADGYWLSGLSVSPANVTLQGSPAVLAEINGFVDTLPVDLSGVEGALSIQTPLDLPAEVEAVDGAGAPVHAVTVNVSISPRRGDLLVTRAVQVLGRPDATVEPAEVDILLNGSLPVLRQIEADPDLVQVWVDARSLPAAANQPFELELQVSAPEGLTSQPVPGTVLVAVAEN